MPTILITGAASGLGAAFVKAYSSKASNSIIALDRQDVVPSISTHQNITTHKLDLTNEQAVLCFAQQLSTTPIDLLIHSAGIRGLVPALEEQYPNDVAACETLEGMNLETMMRTFQINTVATFCLLRALLPSLRLSTSNPKVIVMSSRMGSMGNNELPNAAAGSAYAYRASKAALNAVVRSLAVDVREVAFVLCHPGRVESGLVRGREEGAIGAEESVEGILPLIEGWGVRDSGLFFDRFGGRVEW